MMKADWKTIAVSACIGAITGWKVFKTGRTRRYTGVAKGKRIVVLGGGFGGREAARELARLLPEPGNGEIVLVDQHDYSLFTPMLTDAVGGEIETDHVIVPINHLSDRIQFIAAFADAIELGKKTVRLREEDGPQEITADHLVIALGSTSNFHHIPGVQQAALPMKTVEDAYRIRQNALALLKAASREPDGQQRTAMLTFVVAGGGYTGVETIAALNVFLREKISKYVGLDESQIQMLLVEPMDRLMMEVTEDLATYTQAHLERAGIRVKLKTAIKGVNGDQVELSDGEVVRCRTLIWTAGVEPNPLVASLDAPKSRHKALEVTSELTLSNYSGVWAIGDCAAIPTPNRKGTYGGTAQNATREGVHVARNIVRALKGEPLLPFIYKPIGELAVVGKRIAVARIYGHNFSGLFAWLLWRAIYLAKFPSISQRLRILTDWMLDALLGPVGAYHYFPVAPKSDPSNLLSSAAGNV